MVEKDQRVAVFAAFRLAGHDDNLFTLPASSDEERVFVLPPGTSIARSADLEQVLAQVLRRRVAVLCSESLWARRVPFE
jgi:hypothetical protein